MSPSARKVQSILRERGFGHLEVLELPRSTRTAQEAAQAVGVEVGQIVKSLVFQGERGAYLLLVSGKNRVDLGKVGRLLGQKVAPARAEAVRSLTGFAVGGVPPVVGLPALMDRDLLAYPQVWAAGGTPNALFALTPGELLALTGAQVVDLKEEECSGDGTPT
ncbi:YbaK/EbsC family protein [Thermus filiformis]|uniref:Prolyl-tRNA synthetase n=1 Tax=Thermus filiformis TaxID=276 RepID=A0A0A2WS67_THEFI|nr:YbaK/EbsC family protein [Thermus filiformis]KGQ22638.1 prolyl-tRNA synthetase [Thermus filiformis]